MNGWWRGEGAGRGRGRAGWLAFQVLLMLWSFMVILPVLWVFVSSLKSPLELFGNPWALPEVPQWANFARAWMDAGLGRGFVNSLFVTAVSVAIIILLSAMAAYVLARFTFRGRTFLYYYFVGGLMLPYFLAMVPLFLLVNDLGLLNTYTGLVLVYVAYSLAFTIFMLTGFFRTLPSELEEAAIIDGYSAFGVFWRIMLPLARPGLVSAAIFNLVGIWNEYILGFVLITDKRLFTLPLALADLTLVQRYRTDWGALYAGVVISIVPVMILYSLFQRRLIEGTTAGAVKG